MWRSPEIWRPTSTRALAVETAGRNVRFAPRNRPSYPESSSPGRRGGCPRQGKKGAGSTGECGRGAPTPPHKQSTAPEVAPVTASFSSTWALHSHRQGGAIRRHDL